MNRICIVWSVTLDRVVSRVRRKFHKNSSWFRTKYQLIPYNTDDVATATPIFIIFVSLKSHYNAFQRTGGNGGIHNIHFSLLWYCTLIVLLGIFRIFEVLLALAAVLLCAVEAVGLLYFKSKLIESIQSTRQHHLFAIYVRDFFVFEIKLTIKQAMPLVKPKILRRPSIDV